MIIRELSAIFSFKYNPEGFKKATSALDNLSQKANMVMGTIAGHYLISSFNTFLTNTAQKLDHLSKASQRLGMTANAFNELKYAAEKSAVPIDRLEDCLKELMLRSVDARSGTGDAAEGFKALGISVKDSQGQFRGILDLLDEVSDKVKAMPTQSEQIWALDKLFGDPGYVMLSLLKNGSQGLKELRQEAVKLGLSVDDVAISNAKSFSNNLKRLKMAFEGFSQSLLSNLMPAFSWLTEKIANFLAKFNQLESRAATVRVALIGLSSILGAIAIKLAIAFGPALLSITAIVAAISGVILVVEDLWTAFKGGDAVFKLLYNNAYKLFANIKNLIAKLIPDFLLKGFSNNIKVPVDSSIFRSSSITNLNQSRQAHQQNVNVAVNVKSGANPHEIGQEVSKAVREELLKERQTAFMGIDNYAL